MARTPLEFRVECGRRLRRRRNILGKTQGAIAAAVGMDRVPYAQMAAGRSQAVQLLDLAKLGEELQTSLDYLLLRMADDPGVVPPRHCPEGAVSGVATPLPRSPYPCARQAWCWLL